MLLLSNLAISYDFLVISIPINIMNWIFEFELPSGNLT